MQEVISIIDVIAVGVFAISGALAAAEQKLDILGFVLFGTLTGVGGGTVRDLLLDADAIFWIEQVHYLWVCIGASAATWLMAPLFRSLHRLLLWADAVGIALFCVLGSAKALEYGVPPVVAVILGMMTSTFGSLIRDTLINQRPVLLDPEIYVSATLLGSACYVTLVSFDQPPQLSLAVSIVLGFGLRAAAIVFGLKLPKYGD